MHNGRSKKRVPARTLDHWYRVYTPILIRKLRVYGFTEGESEDICHEVWLKVLTHGYDGAGVFEAYITKITVRHALDVLRTQKRRKNVSLHDEFIAKPTISYDSYAEILRILSFACLQLSLCQQMAFITILYAGRSLQDASMLLSAPVTTLRSRVARARSLMQEPARYTTYPCSIALPVGYAPRDGSGWRELPQERQEYTYFTRESETQELEVVCRYVHE